MRKIFWNRGTVIMGASSKVFQALEPWYYLHPLIYPLGWSRAGVQGPTGLQGPPWTPESGCIQADIKGTWDMLVVRFGGGAIEWGHCTVSILSGGTVQSGSCQNSTGINATMLGGTINVDSGCNVTGHINMSASGSGYTSYIDKAAMSLDKTFFTAVGHNTAGVYSLFNVVKK